MEDSKNLLTRRSDGYVETADGQFAVVMKVATGVVGEVKHFEFALTNFENARLEWRVTDELQIFNQDIAMFLLRRSWAQAPSDKAIAWYNSYMGAADKAAADEKAATEKAAADKAAADEKAATEKAAADKAATAAKK